MKNMDRHLEQANTELDAAKANAKQYGITASTPFADGALLDQLQKRQNELIRLLDLGSNAAPVADSDEAAPPEKKPNPESGAVSLDLLTLGVSKFIRDDVAPALRDVVQGIRSSAADITKLLFPTLLNRESLGASFVLRGKLSELARKSDQARESLKVAAKYFKSRPAAENFDFIDRMELGQRQATPELDAIAKVLRDLLDAKKLDVQSLGTGKLKNFYRDYFPHIWKDPKRAKTMMEAFFGKRPFQGKGAFLKKRSIPTIADGMAAPYNLEPVSTNPIDLVILKVHEMDRYVMAHETLAEWKGLGLAKYFRGNRIPPPGWARIDDTISTVYGKSAAGETIIRGHYYAPEGAARIINNYLSPGLRRFAAYRAVLGLNNVLNQFQLGVSAFHLGFVIFDTTISKMALAYQALLYGHPLKAAKYAAQTPTAFVQTFVHGRRVLKEWNKAGSMSPELQADVQNLITAGGRTQMDQMYQTHLADKMHEALRGGNVLGAAIRAPFAGVEAISNIIMKHVVPAMKAGAFADLARFHMEELGPNASAADVQRVLAQDWNSVENRLGEMTYDNLFWNKTLKDLAMLSVRSVGWNMGTLREVGGAIGDVVMQPYNRLKGNPVNLNRLSYVLALVTTNAIMSAVYQYLKTGKGPDEPEDYFFPKNGETDEAGNPQRISWPSYVKDIYHYTTAPVKTLSNKVAPVWPLFAEMIRNRDFYHKEIRHPDDPLVKQLGQAAVGVAKHFIPMTARNYQREEKLGAKPGALGEQFFGITPAPVDLNRGPAERMAREMSAGHIPDTARTAESAQRHELRQDLTRALRQNKGIPQEVNEARRNGLLSRRDIESAVRAAKQSPLQAAFTQLSIADAFKVYRNANEAERNQIRGLLKKKAQNAIANEPPADRAKTRADLTAALAGR